MKRERKAVINFLTYGSYIHALAISFSFFSHSSNLGKRNRGKMEEIKEEIIHYLDQLIISGLGALWH